MPTPIENIILNSVPNASKQALARRFAGFKGTPQVGNVTRVYLSEQLDEYIEVDQVDVIAEVELGGPASPLVLLFVEPEAKIRHVVVLAERVQADFLAGEITQRNLGGNRAVVSPYPWPNDMPIGQTANCGSWGRACGSWGRACGSWAFC